jgi:hypothetical protein
MTPEERSEACLRTFPVDMISASYEEIHVLIAFAIRAAENDALERAAVITDGRLICGSYSQIIRALKS